MNKIFTFFAGVVVAGSVSGQITTYPHATDFEAEATCGTSCTGVCNLAGDWKNADQWGFAQAPVEWNVYAGATPSAATGPDVDHTVGTAAGKYVYLETSGCNNVQGHLVSEVYDFSALTAPKIKFWYHMLGATMGTMSIDVDPTGLGTWDLDVVAPWTANANVWTEQVVDLSAYAGNPTVRIRIRGNAGTSFTSDMAIDDITVFEPQPYDLQLLTVTTPATGCGLAMETICVSVFNYGTQTILIGDSLDFSYVLNGGTPVVEELYMTADLAPGDMMTYCFTQLADMTINGTYTIDVAVAHLGDISVGNNTGSKTVASIPLVSTFPFVEDFESGQNGWASGGTNSTWAFGTPAGTVINSASSGVNAWCTGNLTGSYLNSDNSYVQGPCFDFSTVCDPTIRLNVWWNAEFSWDGANITTSVDGGATWQLVGALGDQFTWYTDNTINGNPGGYQSGWSGRNSTSNGSGAWVTSTHKLTGLGGQSDVLIRINFATDGSVVDQGFAFDNILIYDGVYLADVSPLCTGNTTTLSADGFTGDTYLWNTAETTSSIVAGTTGWFNVEVTSGVCVNTDSVFVTVLDTINGYANAGPDIAICDTVANFDAGVMDGVDWLWTNGATTQTTQLTGAQSLVMYLYGTSTIPGCPYVSIDSAYVDLFGFNAVDILDTTNCGPVVIDAGAGQSTYLWSNGDAAQTTTVNTSDPNLVVEVTDADGCIAADSIVVVINAIPVIDLGADTTICNHDAITLDAGAGFTDYLWNSLETTQTIAVDGNILGAGSFNYDVTATDANGCEGVDVITVTILNCLGVDEMENITVNIYPNPACEILYVEFNAIDSDVVQISLVNALGQIVLVESNATTVDGKTVYTLDITNLETGMYIVKMTTATQEISNPVIIR